MKRKTREQVRTLARDAISATVTFFERDPMVHSDTITEQRDDAKSQGEAIATAAARTRKESRGMRVRRSYYSEDLLPVIVVVVAVAMAGHLKGSVILAVLGFGYWIWVLLRDRMRMLVNHVGGVQPDGKNFTFKAGKASTYTNG